MAATTRFEAERIAALWVDTQRRNLELARTRRLGGLALITIGRAHAVSMFASKLTARQIGHLQFDANGVPSLRPHGVKAGS